MEVRGRRARLKPTKQDLVRSPQVYVTSPVRPRPRAAPILKILLASAGASTHVANSDGCSFVYSRGALHPRAIELPIRKTYIRLGNTYFTVTLLSALIIRIATQKE